MISKLAAVGLLLAATIAHASGVPAIFLPDTSDAVAALFEAAPDAGATPVFSAGEAAYLLKSGEPRLSRALKLELASEDEFTALARTLAPKGRLERNPGVHATALNPEQWGLRNTGAPQEVYVSDIDSRFIQSVAGEDARSLGAPAEIPGRKTLVAVLDTGVELAHPAVASRVHRTESECQARAAFKECMSKAVDKAVCHNQYDRLDTDGNGYPLDCSGWDMTAAKDPRTGLVGSADQADGVGHGTHVSGIIAGTGFIAGVASEVEILPVKVLGERGGGGNATEFADAQPAPTPTPGLPNPRDPEFMADAVFADTVARGVLYAVRSHAQVINMSLGYPLHEDSELMRRMVALAQAQGALVVAAAGNESSRTPVYPCRYAGVICVGAFSADGSISHFSDFGDAVDIAAPGYGILSAWLSTKFPSFFTERKGYDFKSGTSMAAPFVSGALARLLNAGYAPGEAYARMMLGARPSRPPTEMLELSPKFTLSGNLDLEAAFAEQPRALVLPELKEPVLVAVSRSQALEPRSASFRLALKNMWATGSSVSVALALPSELARKARLSVSSPASFGSWPAGETRLLQGALEWDVPLEQMPGDFYVEVTVLEAGHEAWRFKKSFEFVVPVRPLSLAAPQPTDARVSRLATDLTAQGLPANYAIKPVTCLPGTAGGSDLLLLQKPPGNSTVLQILSEQGTGAARSLRKTGGHLLDQSKEQMFALSCVDVDRDGKRDYMIATFHAQEKLFKLTYLDSTFRRPPGAPRYEFSTDTVTMPENFRWLSGVAGSPRLAPVFIARGRRPESELGKFDPWDKRTPEQRNPADHRLYYVDGKGLHTVAVPAGYRWAALAEPSRDELMRGTARVVLFKGTDFTVDFFVAELTGSADGLKLGALKAVDFSLYHRIAGLKSQPVLGQAGAAVAGVYSEDGTLGRLRASLLPSTGTQILPWVLEPLKRGDRLTEIIAAYGETAGEARAFTRSRFQLYYHERAGSRTLGTDLKQYDSITRHLAARMGDGTPAVVLPEGQGSTLTNEVITPRQVDGEWRLMRPATLKTLGVEGCEQVQLKVTGVAGAGQGVTQAVDRMLYFCGDHFVEIAF